MQGKWDDLFCQYFKDTVSKLLRSYFSSFGFYEKQVTKNRGVFFLSPDGLFVELSYEPESFPKFTPTVIIGKGGKKFDKRGNAQSVPLWFVIPEKSPERLYSAWKFSTVDQLETTLQRIKNEILEKHAMPLVRDVALLEKKIKLFG